MHKPEYLHTIFKPQKAEGICLFCPGVPYTTKEKKFFIDCRKAQYRLFQLTYPGFQENHGLFTPDTTMEYIMKAVQYCMSFAIPTIIIGYSFSTYFLQKYNFATYKNTLKSVIFFSPILGLDNTTINENFQETLLRLSTSPEFRLQYNAKSWEKLTQSHELAIQLKDIQSLAMQNIPLRYYFTSLDSIIQPEKIQKILEKVKNKHISFAVSHYGNHRIDSYYNHSAQNYFRQILKNVE